MGKKSNIRLVVIGVLAVVGMFIFWVGSNYNILVNVEADVDEKWSQVENVYQRRNDLIPNLVNSVQGSMEQEKGVFGKIAEARQQSSNASNVGELEEANGKLNQEVQTLINVIQEDYPELASNENVKGLMAQLEGSENRISVERKRYNETVTVYNKKIRKLPMNLVAGMLGFEKKELFQMDEGADQVPEVDFGVGE